MSAAPLPIELVMLGCAIALVLLQIVLHASADVIYLGIPYLIGPRDVSKANDNVYAGRLGRALRNLLDTFPLFATLAVALAVSGRTGGSAALGAQIYVWARTIYLPLYVFGVPVARSIAWGVSMAGIVMMLAALLAK